MPQITMSRELAERYRTYSDVTGKSFDEVLQHALDDWMTIVGEADLEVITGVPFGAPSPPCVASTAVVH